MNYTLEQARKIVEDYNNLMKEASTIYWSRQNITSIIDKLEALGLEWGDKLHIPCDFSVERASGGSRVLNSALNYKPKEGEWLVHWDNGNVGAYQFVNSRQAYDAVYDEWTEFKKVLLTYNPLDYDTLNCHIIYDIENGKRVMADYNKICDDTRAEMREKIKQAELQKAREEYERLLAKLEEDI